MKAYRSYFRQKNSKQGIALSTAMAICIVLAILTAILISMATLNITTTQTNISQREAYIQAKSAIAFAESYYSKNPDQIPGNAGGDTGGEALFVFKSDVVADGADIYLIGTTSNPNIIDPATVQNLKNNAVDTYLEVTNTGAYVDLSAYCKYGDNNAYSLAKEFEYKSSSQNRPSSYTGNILYSATGDTRYLRIHVRTSDAFGNEPYIYTYGNPVNNQDAANFKGGSASVNKLSYDANYPDQKFSGEWGTDGPTGTMEYEGNGWFVSEVQFASNSQFNYINAIITRKGALRSNPGFSGATSQSWEIFGIPVPGADGSGNGTDVYITLNQPTLRDARMVQKSTSSYYWADLNYDSGGNADDSKDELTFLFSERFGNDIDKFAKFSAQWYTVYTKQVSAIVHYKKAGVTNDSAKPADFDYEGYGWSRRVSRYFSDTITVAGTTYYYGSTRATTLSSDSNGNAMVTELFIVEAADGSASAEFGTEAEANQWLVENGDAAAPDYVTINVKANEMPVADKVPTTISYNASIIKGDTDTPRPGDSTGSSGDPDVSSESDKLDELEVAPLAQKGVQKSGDATTAAIANWGIAGSFPGNDWGLNGGTQRKYENFQKMVNTSGYIHEYTYENLPAGTYEFKIVSMAADSGNCRDDMKWIGNGSANVVVDVPEGHVLKIVFDRNNCTIDTYVTDPNSGGNTESGNTYFLFCDKNNWGREAGASGNHYYEYAYQMHSNGDGTYYYDVTGINSSDLQSGGLFHLKVLRQLSGASGPDDNSAGWSSDNSWGKQNSTDDYTISVTANSMSNITIRVYFDEYQKRIWNDPPVDVGDVSSDKFYAIGSFNHWGEDDGTAHTYAAATAGDKYYFGEPVKLEGSYAIYELDIGMQEIGELQTKVFAYSDTSGDGDIDYNKSWGAADTSGITSGSDKQPLTHVTDDLYYVKIVFSYDLSNPDKSKIQYVLTPRSLDDDTVTWVQVAFYNAQLEDINEPHDKTNFHESGWSEVYVTYSTNRGTMEKDVLLDTSKATGDNGEILWVSLPSDALDVYFSNMKYEDRTKDGYEYTVKLGNDRITNSYPIFVPTKAEPDSKGKLCWEFGNSSFYRSYTNSVTRFSVTDEPMTSVGSYQVNYYNVPLVNMLDEILKKDKGLTGNYAYAAFPYSNYEVKNVETVTFDRNRYIEYQGEKYFYTGSKGYNGVSYLIVQDTAGTKGGYLLRNQFSLQEGVYGGVNVKMNNRQGAVFTSSGSYYDGTASAHGYGDYTPNWYTIKLPVTDDFTIESITGVVGDGVSILSGNTSKTKVAKANEYYNRPIYIYYDKDKDGNQSAKFYTYDTEFGSVDTNESGNVTVYFNKPSSWSNDVCVNAYSVVGAGVKKDINKDATDTDTNYYKFEFKSGEYCFFKFYDKNDVGKTTGILTLTGEENDNREYRILCDANVSMDEFTFYLHPKTRALYAWQEARAAKYAAEIPASYSYDGTTYTPTAGSSKTLAFLNNLVDATENYYKNSTSWSASGSSSNNDKAYAARTFAAAIKKARIYIAADPADVTAGKDEAKYLFPERESRDAILAYEKRWVTTLREVHDNAMKLYNESSSADITGSLLSYAAQIDSIIARPETILNTDAIQIIVDNQVVAVKKKDASGNDILDASGNPETENKGGWDISRIRLYTKDASGAVTIADGLKLYETTQSSQGYYAYVFMGDKFPSTDFCVGTINSVPGESDLMTLESGRTYIYHTATGEFEPDTSPDVQYCVPDMIVKDGQGAAYGEYRSKRSGDDIVIMFDHDTQVDGGTSDTKYTIYAGAYTINSNYPNFTRDFSSEGKTGINLFTAEAKTFFEEPARAGLTGGTTFPLTYSEMTTSLSGGGADLDVVTNKINPSGGSSIDFSSSDTTGRVNFRWENTNGNDTLTLNGKTVKLSAGVCTVALNNLELTGGGDFIIEAKSITFYCDTEVNGVPISHGTYIFNDSSSSTLVPVALSTTGKANDWRKNYVLVEEVKSDLGGGKFVVK